MLHDFEGYPTQNGGAPYTAPMQASDGNFYGTTSQGGGGSCTFGCGTIYKFAADGTYTVIYSFQTVGSGPGSGLIQASDGNFYGTTAGGGGSPNCYPTSGCGTIYKITPEGALTTVYSFNEEADPAQVIQASDGNLYGVTYGGGASPNCSGGCGTIFRLTPGGVLTTLYSFSGSDGSGPTKLLQATDGSFYGITLGGGSGKGTVFKLTGQGTFSTLYSFNGADGWEPASLIQAANGNFFGVTLAGGASGGGGTVFEITSAGALTTIYNFCTQKRCEDGNEAYTLMQASDGNFYGTTLWGGSAVEGGGTIFEINGGTFATLHKFAPADKIYLGGQAPAGLIQGTDGNFYGTTISGGTSDNCVSNCGTIFSFGPATAKLSIALINFGNEVLQETSAAHTLTLKNSGVTVLNGISVFVSTEFAIAADGCTGRTLSAGQTCKVSVTFTPTALGLQTGTLSFTDNASGSPQTIPLKGKGTSN
ncbi:MAG TPA: choice-of-anchor tandem repeat GloVer-containing protein [Terriglobales bacterium]|nr:choice-of-anchor tandem repeat GloVer-containing protein [Terriglobales bacterium]